MTSTPTTWTFITAFSPDSTIISPGGSTIGSPTTRSETLQALSFIPPTLNQHLFSAFAQDEIALSKTVAFTAGTKLFASETVIADEIGSRAQVGETMSISTSAYDNRYDDLRSTSLSAPDPVLHLPFPLFFENNLDGHTYASSSA